MAITASLYNHTAKKFANGEVNLADLFFMLLDADGIFDAAHTSIDDVAGGGSPSHPNQVAGNGWTAGGEQLANAAVSVVTTNDAKLDADDISKTAVGGAIGPASFGAVYEKTSGDLLVHVNFDGSKEAGETTDFKVIWNASGIIAWTVA